MFPSSLGLRHAKSATQSDAEAIPVLKRYSHGSTLSPKKACLKSLYVLWCPQQAVHTWPTLHKNQQDEPAIMNRDNCNIFLYISGFSITISYVHVRNTVKRYRELWTTIPMSMSLNAPSHILSSACSYCIVVWLDLCQCYQIRMKGASEKNATLM